MTIDTPDDRVYEQCPFCQEEQVDTTHLIECSKRDAQILVAAQQEKIPNLSKLCTALCRAKTLCDTFESHSVEVQGTMWCCQDCYAFGYDAVPDRCTECGGLHTSPAPTFLDDTAAT